MPPAATLPNVGDVGPYRHQLQSKCPAYEFLIRMQNLETVHILVREAAARQGYLLGGHILEFFQKRIGDLRPAVLETRVRVLGGVLD